MAKPLPKEGEDEKLKLDVRIEKDIVANRRIVRTQEALDFGLTASVFLRILGFTGCVSALVCDV